MTTQGHESKHLNQPLAERAGQYNPLLSAPNWKPCFQALAFTFEQAQKITARRDTPARP